MGRQVSARGRPRGVAPGLVVAIGVSVLTAWGCAHRQAAPMHARAVELQAAGAAALARGDLDRAAGQFALALEYEPRMAEAENGLGLVALRYGDTTGAARAFHAALTLDEDLAEAHLNLGGILLAEGSVEEALERFRAALAIDPGYAAARLAAGEALLRLGRLQDARWELAKMCEADPGSAAAHAAHALVLARLDRIALAETSVRRALDIAPDFPAAHRARAEILRRGGDLAGAEGELRVVLRAEGGSPRSVDDRLALGTVLAAQGRMDDAAAVLAAATLVAPRNPAIHFALAYVELGRERADAAAVAARRALELRARFPQARLLLAEALFRGGETKQAWVELRAFIDEAPAEMATEKARAVELLSSRLSPATSPR